MLNEGGKEIVIRQQQRGPERRVAAHLFLMLQLVANDGLVLGAGSQGNETRQSDGKGTPDGEPADADDHGRDESQPEPLENPYENKRVEEGFEAEWEEGHERRLTLNSCQSIND